MALALPHMGRATRRLTRGIAPKNQEGGGKKPPSLLVDCCEWVEGPSRHAFLNTHTYIRKRTVQNGQGTAHTTHTAGMGHAHTTPNKRKQGTQGAKYKDHKLI